jgi:hypothetical protein
MIKRATEIVDRYLSKGSTLRPLFQKAIAEALVKAQEEGIAAERAACLDLAAEVGAKNAMQGGTYVACKICDAIRSRSLQDAPGQAAEETK